MPKPEPNPGGLYGPARLRQFGWLPTADKLPCLAAISRGAHAGNSPLPQTAAKFSERGHELAPPEPRRTNAKILECLNCSLHVSAEVGRTVGVRADRKDPDTGVPGQPEDAERWIGFGIAPAQRRGIDLDARAEVGRRLSEDWRTRIHESGGNPVRIAASFGFNLGRSY
jgi:hypothetical protein